jgi:hypothetical protein
MGPSLKVVVFALPDDLSSLVLLEHIQEHLGEGRHKVRFVVLMNELRWAEAFSMLDAVPLHEFVSATQVILLCMLLSLTRLWALPSVYRYDAMSFV